jgi:hypothetical protein
MNATITATATTETADRARRTGKTITVLAGVALAAFAVAGVADAIDLPDPISDCSAVSASHVLEDRPDTGEGVPVSASGDRPRAVVENASSMPNPFRGCEPDVYRFGG